MANFLQVYPKINSLFKLFSVYSNLFVLFHNYHKICDFQTKQFSSFVLVLHPEKSTFSPFDLVQTYLVENSTNLKKKKKTENGIFYQTEIKASPILARPQKIMKDSNEFEMEIKR